MIRMKLPIRKVTKNQEEQCRQDCDICRTPCEKQGRYSKKGLTQGHLDLGKEIPLVIRAHPDREYPEEE